MNIKIRRARIDEAEILTELSMRSKQSNGYDEAFMTACREELTVTSRRMKEGKYWIAESDEICGMACLLTDKANVSGEIHAFFIDPDHQGKGIGRLLWQKLHERAKTAGLTSLHLDADPNAVAFYQAIGFKITGEVPSGSIPGRNLPYMTMSI